MLRVFSLERAGSWFLHSGIQEPSGGVARYYDASVCRNRAISTEITGYAASTYAYLYQATGKAEYADRAQLTAKFLATHVWKHELQAFPFEHPSPSEDGEHHSYFFDTGIIIRGLTAVWRLTREDLLLDVGAAAAHKMASDFHSGNDYHPILSLPEKTPLLRDERWSRSSDCYQLKAAVAWWEISEITGDGNLRERYLEMLTTALARHESFLPGTGETSLIMDRLHAYLYFLEGLAVALPERPECRTAYQDGLAVVAGYLEDVAPTFLRADVCGQLLRARLYGDLAGVTPIDQDAAAREAELLTSFQMTDSDVRIDGGVAFGRRDGELVPHINPWATGFAIQALDMWNRFRTGSLDPCPQLPI